MTRRRNRRVWLGAGAALAITGWLILSYGDRRAHAPSPGDATGAAQASALVQGEVKLALPRDARIPLGPDGEPLTHGRVEVRVTDANGDPMYGVEVIATCDDPQESIREGGATDTEGYAQFADLPYDGSWQVMARGARGDVLGGSWRRLPPDVARIYDGDQAAVHGPDVALRLSALPVDVRAEAADSGVPLRGLHVTLHPTIAGWGWRTGDLLPLFASVGDRADTRVAASLFRAPEGYVVRDRLERGGPIAPAARRLEAVIPVRPQAQLVVQGVKRDFRTYKVFVDGSPVQAHATRVSEKAVQLLSVPFLSGARVQVMVHEDDERWWGGATLGVANDERTVVLARAKQEEWPAFDERYHFKLWGAWRTVHESASSPPPPPVDPDDVASRVEIRVQDMLGRPARGAFVGLHGQMRTSDAVGRVVFRDVPVGRHALTVWGAGPAWSDEIDVARTKRQTEHVRMPPAGTVTLQVVDEEGKGVSYAEVTVHQSHELPWCDLDGDTQRIDPYTDPTGVRRLRNLEPEKKIGISAKLGRRVGATSVVVPAGGHVGVRVVLGEPKKSSNTDNLGFERLVPGFYRVKPPARKLDEVDKAYLGSKTEK